MNKKGSSKKLIACTKPKEVSNLPRKKKTLEVWDRENDIMALYLHER